MVFQAARNGLTGALRDLINDGVNVDDLDENGVSPLHYAARFNHYEAVELLVKKGNAGILLNSIALTSTFVTELANTMGDGCYITLFLRVPIQNGFR